MLKFFVKTLRCSRFFPRFHANAALPWTAADDIRLVQQIYGDRA